MSPTRLVLRIALGLALTGCATVGGIRSEPLSAGMERTFTANHASVVKAAREAMIESGLTLQETRELDDTTSIIIGTTGMSMMSYGELVRLVVQKIDAEVSLVRVHMRRRVATNVTAKDDYAPRILSYIEFKLR